MGKVFISYSHKDRKWKDRIVKHLGVLEKEKKLAVWDDRQIAVGGDWLPEIEHAIQTCDVALFLISVDFLNSPFILGQEVPRLLERRLKEGIRIIPVILWACLWTEVAWLSGIQACPTDGEPLSSFSKPKAESTLAALAKEVLHLTVAIPPYIPEHLTPVLVKKKRVHRKSGIKVSDRPHDVKPKWEVRSRKARPGAEHLADDGPFEQISDDEKRRRSAVRGDDLKYYFYLSELKVNMLYDQLGGADTALTKYQKLSVILRHLEEKGAIGTLEEPSSYFAGELYMQWRVLVDRTNQIEVVFFLGHLNDKIVGLGGSPTHLLGRAQSSPMGSSVAATQAALNYFLREEKALRQAGEAIKPQDSEPEEVQMIKDWKTLLMRTSESFVFQSELISEKLEFVAKTLVTQEGVLLGTPLYVALP